MFIETNKKVEPLIWQDYPDWHKNRQNFAVWYIEIDHPTIIHYCQKLRQQFSQFLHDDYHRQFHITLFVNGFLVDEPQFDDDFTSADLARQIDQLQNMNCPAFSVYLTHIHSFSSSLFIQVNDEYQYLTKLRQQLGQTLVEVAPTQYVPHITLGFYHQAFLGQTILDKIAQVTTQNIEMKVNKLICGIYQANQLQGKLNPIFTLDLRD